MAQVKFTIEFTADLDREVGQFHNPKDWHEMAMREVLRQTHYNTEAKVTYSKIVENSLKYEEKRTIEVYDCETEKLIDTFEVSEKYFKEDEWCLNEPAKYPFGPDSDVKWAVWRLKGDNSPIPSR